MKKEDYEKEYSILTMDLGKAIEGLSISERLRLAQILVSSRVHISKFEIDPTMSFVSSVLRRTVDLLRRFPDADIAEPPLPERKPRRKAGAAAKPPVSGM